jgi:hypothetical protein
MALFSRSGGDGAQGDRDVPDTIGAEKSGRLWDAGARLPWTTPEAAAQRAAQIEQHQKRHLS